MTEKGNAAKIGATLCGIVLGAFVLRSCWNFGAENRAYRALMDNDKVPPSAYTTEDGIKVAASKTWETDNDILAYLPNGDIIQYINAQDDDMQLESVVITNTEGQKTILPDDPAFAQYQQQYDKHVKGLRLKYGEDRALGDAMRLRDEMKRMGR